MQPHNIIKMISVSLIEPYFPTATEKPHIYKMTPWNLLSIVFFVDVCWATFAQICIFNVSAHAKQYAFPNACASKLYTCFGSSPKCLEIIVKDCFLMVLHCETYINA